jgi:predicted phage terminase large subunit-like protein
MVQAGEAWVFDLTIEDSSHYVLSNQIVAQNCGFDEATQFEPEIYEYLLSRIRKPVISCAICTQPLNRYILKGKAAFRHSKGQKGACSSPLPDPGAMSQYTPAPDGTTIFDIPLRMRLTANPGGLSHMYFKERFIDGTMRDGDGKPLDAAFIPSALKDNPSLNQAEYQQQLANLSPVDRERLLNGNWEIMDEGAWFHRGLFDYIDAPPNDKDVIGRCRFWDFAATDNKSSDYTAGALCSITTDGRWIIEDMKRFKKLPAEVEREVKKTAIEDGINIPVYSEMELGSSGKALASHYTRNVLPGFQYKAIRVTGKKEARAGALASQAADHNVYIVKGDWNLDFVNEITTFPTGHHDDQVDAVAHAFIQLAQLSGKRKVRIVV